MKTCQECSRDIAQNRNKFCGNSCAATFRNRGVRRHGKEPRSCLNCESVTRNEKYCSLRCQHAYQGREALEDWKSGRLSGTTASGEPAEVVRRYIRSKKGEKCWRCGWCERNPHTGIVPVQIHHIDGDWKNNREENLELLCPNCHSLTGNYGSRNIGKGEGRCRGVSRTEASALRRLGSSPIVTLWKNSL